MWNWVILAGGITILVGAMVWVCWCVEKEDRAYRKACAYVMSDQGIKAAARRHARFVKRVQEELRREEEARPD